MGITALPNPPNSGNPATFNDDADTFLGALPTMVTEINALLPSIAAKLWATVGSGSTANALVLTCGFPALAVGTQIRFRATAANTGAATLNLDGLGAKACRTVTGVALPAGYIRTDADTLATYDGTYWVLDRAPERGSNANGSYVRYADGSQRCEFANGAGTGYGPVTTAAGGGGGYISAPIGRTFPAAFIAIPTVAPEASRQIDDTNIVMSAACAITTTGFKQYLWTATSLSLSGLSATYVAFGAWY